MSPTSRACRETRRDRRHAGRVPIPLALGSPGCSCRVACRCARPPATLVHPMGLGSPPRQCLNDGGRQSRRHCSRDPDASIARQFDLDRWHRRHRNAIARRSHQHPSKTIGSCSQIPPPTINQARCHVSLTGHVPYHCAGRKRRRDNRLLLLAAPPTPPLGTGQYLDARHCTRLLHRCKHRCLHWFLPARSNHKSQGGPRRTVTA